MENKIFGITLKSALQNVYDKFEEDFFESDHAFFVSKETFTHEDDGLNFDYKYAIEADYCEGKIFYMLNLVPCANSLNKAKLESVASCSGVDESEVNIYDICAYGCSVMMGCESVESEDVDEHYLNVIASVFESVDRLRGFYLDKYVNRIGNTGWDLLDDFVNGKDYISKALNRA